MWRISPSVQVEPAEDQSLVLGVEGAQPLRRVVDHRVALDQRAGRAGAGQPVALALHPLRLRAQRLHPGVHAIDVALLGGDLRLARHLGHGRSFTPSQGRSASLRVWPGQHPGVY